jgi:hypothetical protein
VVLGLDVLPAQKLEDGRTDLDPVTVSEPPSYPVEAQVISAESDPGSINSVWTVKLKLIPLPNATSQPAEFTLAIGGVPLGDPLAVWVKPQQ